MIRTVDGSLYAGITTDVARRFKEHLTGGRKAAKYLVAHKPKSIAFSIGVGGHSLALKVEYRFKRLAKRDKEKIVRRKKLVFDDVTGEIVRT